MTLQQLRYLCEIVNAKFNLSRAAKVLHTSQPGVSRYMRLLENELGLELLVRNKKRIAGLTPGGSAIAQVAQQVTSQIANLKPIAQDYQSHVSGSLTIATGHAHARYTLPKVVERFISRYPRVELRLRQGYLSQIVNWVKTGEADLLIATTPAESVPDLALLPCHELHRVVLTLPGHPLLAKRKVSLADLARYPIITYDSVFSAYRQIVGAFHAKNLSPNIVLSASDADIMKTYVLAGLGITITAHTAFDKRLDTGLRSIDVRHLFEPGTVHVGVRRNAYLSKHMMHFIRLFAPHLRESRIKRAFCG